MKVSLKKIKIKFLKMKKNNNLKQVRFCNKHNLTKILNMEELLKIVMKKIQMTRMIILSLMIFSRILMKSSMKVNC